MNFDINSMNIRGCPATLELLDRHLAAWRESGEPPEPGYLCSGEWTALAIAARREDLLCSPVIGFLLLDGWLQAWVIESRGLGYLTGTRIGV